MCANVPAAPADAALWGPAIERVLITSAQERFALAAARSLAAAGYSVSAVADQTPAATHWSRSCDARYTLKDPKEDADAFVDGLVEIVKREPHAVLLPGTDAALMAVSSRRDRLEPYVRLGLPSREAVEASTDKIRLVDAANRSGLSSPPTVVCHSREDGLRAAAELGLPVVIKPQRTAFELNGAVEQRGGQYLADKAALATALDLFGSPYLIQGVVRGSVYSVGGVMDGDELVALAASRYLRTWPPEAGNVAFSETIEPPAALAGQVAALLRALGWSGIFELELIGSGDDLHAIDLNPRLYGSLALANRAGAPLAAIFCDRVLGRDGRRVTARSGVYYRWEDADLRHALARLREGRLGAAGAALRPHRNVAHAYFGLADPGPLAARVLLLAGRRVRRPA